MSNEVEKKGQDSRKGEDSDRGLTTNPQDKETQEGLKNVDSTSRSRRGMAEERRINYRREVDNCRDYLKYHQGRAIKRLMVLDLHINQVSADSTNQEKARAQRELDKIINFSRKEGTGLATVYSLLDSGWRVVDLNPDTLINDGDDAEVKQAIRKLWQYEKRLESDKLNLDHHTNVIEKIKQDHPEKAEELDTLIQEMHNSKKLKEERKRKREGAQQ